MTEGKRKKYMEAWVLYDARLGFELPNTGDTPPYWFDNEEDALETKDSEHQEIIKVNILTDEELEAEREEIAREAFIVGWTHEGGCKGNALAECFNDYWQQKQKEQDDKR